MLYPIDASQVAAGDVMVTRRERFVVVERDGDRLALAPAPASARPAREPDLSSERLDMSLALSARLGAVFLRDDPNPLPSEPGVAIEGPNGFAVRLWGGQPWLFDDGPNGYRGNFYTDDRVLDFLGRPWREVDLKELLERRGLS